MKDKCFLDTNLLIYALQWQWTPVVQFYIQKI